MAKVIVHVSPLGSERIRRLFEDAARTALEDLYPELERVLGPKPAPTREGAYFAAELEGDE